MLRKPADPDWPSPKEIAAKVEKPQALVRAEQALVEADERHRAALRKLTKHAAALRDQKSTVDQRYRDLEASENALRQERATARARAKAERPAYLERLKDALWQHSGERGARIAEHVASMRNDIEWLYAADRELSYRGGEIARPPWSELDLLEARAILAQRRCG